MIKPHILVVDSIKVFQMLADGEENDQYRAIVLTGCTYSERTFREWVNDRWKTPIDAPLDDLVAAAKKGGWVCYFTPGVQLEGRIEPPAPWPRPQKGFAWARKG